MMNFDKLPAMPGRIAAVALAAALVMQAGTASAQEVAVSETSTSTTTEEMPPVPTSTPSSGTSTASSTTLASDTTTQVQYYNIPGQSFTVTGSAQSYNNIVIAFQGPNGDNRGKGNLYLFSSPYSGKTSQISRASDAIGSASFSNGTFKFDNSIVLDADKNYYVYGDTSFLYGVNLNNGYTGGSLYLPFYDYDSSSGSSSGSFEVITDSDANFTVTGTAVTTAAAVAAVPEPATWGMMIVGLGVAGTALRRRRAAATQVARTA